MRNPARRAAFRQSVGKYSRGLPGLEGDSGRVSSDLDEAVNAEAIAEPPIACTGQLKAEQPVVLCIQDTTSLDVNGQNIEGLDPLLYEAQRGMFLYPTCVVTPNRKPLG